MSKEQVFDLLLYFLFLKTVFILPARLSTPVACLLYLIVETTINFVSFARSRWEVFLPKEQKKKALQQSIKKLLNVII